MSPVFAVIAVAALGIDVGWQPLDEGGVEYIIQIEPDQVDRMKNFDDLISDVPKDLDVRRYRITIGTEKLPRLTKKAATPTKATETPASESAPVERATNREVIAEGAIPAARKTPVMEKATDGPVLVDPTPDEKEVPEATEDSAALETTTDDTAPAETTAQKPVDGTFAADPEPKDEEESDLAPPPATRTLSRPRTDDLFEPAPTRPMNSRLLEDPPVEPASRALLKGNRITREEPEPDYETTKPSLPDSFRTVQRTERPTTTEFDREPSGSDGAWGSVIAIFFFLLLSMGANMWLGWIAWEARQRYQILLEKYRAAGGKSAVDLA